MRSSVLISIAGSEEKSEEFSKQRESSRHLNFALFAVVNQ
jgi:hypothetical protein